MVCQGSLPGYMTDEKVSSDFKDGGSTPVVNGEEKPIRVVAYVQQEIHGEKWSVEEPKHLETDMIEVWGVWPALLKEVSCSSNEL